MNNLERRIEQAEEALGMGQETIVVNIVLFGRGPRAPVDIFPRSLYTFISCGLHCCM